MEELLFDERQFSSREVGSGVERQVSIPEAEGSVELQVVSPSTSWQPMDRVDEDGSGGGGGGGSAGWMEPESDWPPQESRDDNSPAGVWVCERPDRMGSPEAVPLREEGRCTAGVHEKLVVEETEASLPILLEATAGGGGFFSTSFNNSFRVSHDNSP